MDWLNQALFGYYPYLALTVLATGCVLRFDREQYTWRTGSSQLLRRKQLVLGSILFHLGILAIFAGHFVGLLTPIVVWETLGVPHSAKQMLAIVAGGSAGLLCLAGGLLLLHRRLFDPRIRANSSFGDTAILVLLMAQLLLGLSTIPISLQHSDGSEMLKFMNWAQSVFTFRAGAADLIADASPVFKAHITLGLTILLVFPFTRLVHMLSAPVWYLNRRGWQIVRSKHLAVERSVR
ncbi:MAG: respiratory nitrate reductase subunit gamma [Proteobacteria bacterium]|nr:respiratory nitrate reductase subunit gamma [Pseudomonadota bacterium]